MVYLLHSFKLGCGCNYTVVFASKLYVILIFELILMRRVMSMLYAQCTKKQLFDATSCVVLIVVVVVVVVVVVMVLTSC